MPLLLPLLLSISLPASLKAEDSFNHAVPLTAIAQTQAVPALLPPPPMVSAVIQEPAHLPKGWFKNLLLLLGSSAVLYTFYQAALSRKSQSEE